VARDSGYSELGVPGVIGCNMSSLLRCDARWSSDYYYDFYCIVIVIVVANTCPYCDSCPLISALSQFCSRNSMWGVGVEELGVS